MVSMATSSSQRDPITFPDKKMETGVVLRRFLDAIHTGAVEGIGFSEYTLTIKRLIRFARKWECPEVVAMISQESSST